MIQTENQPNYLKYAALINEKIAELIDEEIGMDELQEENNLTDFFYALTTLSPALFYNNITGEKINNLEFNHMANKLCFQYLRVNQDKLK